MLDFWAVRIVLGQRQLSPMTLKTPGFSRTRLPWFFLLMHLVGKKMDSRHHLARGIVTWTPCVLVILFNLGTERTASKGGTLKWSKMWWNLAAEGQIPALRHTNTLLKSDAEGLLSCLLRRAGGRCKMSQLKSFLYCVILSNVAFHVNKRVCEIQLIFLRRGLLRGDIPPLGYARPAFSKIFLLRLYLKMKCTEDQRVWKVHLLEFKLIQHSSKCW